MWCLLNCLHFLVLQDSYFLAHEMKRYGENNSPHHYAKWSYCFMSCLWIILVSINEVNYNWWNKRRSCHFRAQLIWTIYLIEWKNVAHLNPNIPQSHWKQMKWTWTCCAHSYHPTFRTNPVQRVYYTTLQTTLVEFWVVCLRASETLLLHARRKTVHTTACRRRRLIRQPASRSITEQPPAQARAGAGVLRLVRRTLPKRAESLCCCCCCCCRALFRVCVSPICVSLLRGAGETFARATRLLRRRRRRLSVGRRLLRLLRDLIFEIFGVECVGLFFGRAHSRFGDTQICALWVGSAKVCCLLAVRWSINPYFGCENGMWWSCCTREMIARWWALREMYSIISGVVDGGIWSVKIQCAYRSSHQTRKAPNCVNNPEMRSINTKHNTTPHTSQTISIPSSRSGGKVRISAIIIIIIVQCASHQNATAAARSRAVNWKAHVMLNMMAVARERAQLKCVVLLHVACVCNNYHALK